MSGILHLEAHLHLRGPSISEVLSVSGVLYLGASLHLGGPLYLRGSLLPRGLLHFKVFSDLKAVVVNLSCQLGDL